MKKITLSILMILFLVSCGSTGQQSDALSPQNSYSKSLLNPSYAKKSSLFNFNSSDRKIIYNTSLELFVDDIEASKVSLSEIAKYYDGYLEHSNQYSVKIRVNPAKMDSVIESVSALGEVENISISAWDQTSVYTESELKLENALKSRERYLELLKKAETVEEILLVEKELERLNYEIQSLKNSIKSIDDQIELTTLTIFVKQDKSPGPIGYIFVGLYKGIRWLFVWD